MQYNPPYLLTHSSWAIMEEVIWVTSNMYLQNSHGRGSTKPQKSDCNKKNTFYTMGWYHFAIAEELEKEKKPTTNDTLTDKKAAVADAGETPCVLPVGTDPEGLTVPQVPIYHLAQRQRWFDAVRDQRAYFPPTFVLDGRFTRASLDLDGMVDVANEFYKESEGDWICLELDPQVILELGIQIEAHMAPESTPDTPVRCLKVFGGITTKLPELVKSIHAMSRDQNGTFLSFSQLDCGCAARKAIEEQEKKIKAAKLQAARQSSKRTLHLSPSFPNTSTGKEKAETSEQPLKTPAKATKGFLARLKKR